MTPPPPRANVARFDDIIGAAVALVVVVTVKNRSDIWLVALVVLMTNGSVSQQIGQFLPMLFLRVLQLQEKLTGWKENIHDSSNNSTMCELTDRWRHQLRGDNQFYTDLLCQLTAIVFRITLTSDRSDRQRHGTMYCVPTCVDIYLPSSHRRPHGSLPPSTSTCLPPASNAHWLL